MEIIDDQITKEGKARARAKELRGFYNHLITYCVFSVFFFLVNFFTNPGKWWFYWPMFGWGIGLFFHASSVFLKNQLFGQDWEDRKTRELMDKDNS